jgi:hypothetical protein
MHHLFELSAIPARPTWLVIHPDVAMQPAVRVVADRLVAAFGAISK